MSKIEDVVKIKSGYTTVVDLKNDYEGTQENADRMAMYRPTKSHRQAFERICRGIYQPNDKKFYLLSGSYGTGKSHLCLMLANFLSRSSGDPEITGFYDNYIKLNPEQGKRLKNIRRDGQYLVAICDYKLGLRFEDAVLKAVLEACSNRGLTTVIKKTEFDSAKRLLEKWCNFGNQGKFNLYEQFSGALAQVKPSRAVEQLCASLANYDSEALSDFKAAFSKMMLHGVEFQVQSSDLNSILNELLESKEFKERFKGLAILFDELGSNLDSSNYSKDILQGFMESICQRKSNMLFVGCIHKDFKSYADRFNKDDVAVMSARITQVDLLNEGIEEIIGAIVETDKESSVWRNEIEPKARVFDQLIPTCKTLNLFPWIDDNNRIRQKVLEDIYGMHPMALACLLTLSSEIGSDLRSTFSFFSGEVAGLKDSYADFIKTADVLVNGGKLNLYTVDRLFGFFEEDLSVDNTGLRDTQRQFVNGFYASKDALKKAVDELLKFEDDERIRILQTILVYRLCQIPSNIENIQFGLYCSNSSEEKQVAKRLDDLDKKGAVFYRRQSKTYELIDSTGEDPYDLIERYLKNEDLHSEDIVSALLEEVGDEIETKFQPAQGYNLQFYEDKRFRICVVHAKDLGEVYIDELRKEWEKSQERDKTSYEGTLIYPLCENEFEVNQVREAVKFITDQNIALCVPYKPQPFRDILLRVKACRHYLAPNNAEKISAQTQHRLRGIFDSSNDGYLQTLTNRLDSILKGYEACWYWSGGRVLIDKPKQPHIPADKICVSLFEKRCRINHSDLNNIHDEKWRTGKNIALKEAVRILLEAENVIIDNGSPDNHGEKRYLEKVLLIGAGALKKTGFEGHVSYFQCEYNPVKIHDGFPLLKTLCERLAQLNQRTDLPVGPFLKEVRQPPYGASGTQLVLSLAHVIRAYGERLVVYEDSTKEIKQTIQSYDDIVSIVENPTVKVVFKVREITELQYKLIDQIAQSVNALPLKHGKTRSLSDAFEALNQWWTRVPELAKVLELYPKDVRQRFAELIELLDGLLENVDSFKLLLEDLPNLYSSGPGAKALSDADVNSFAQSFKADVNQLNGAAQKAERLIADAICEVYGGKGDMVDCENLVTNWYKSLNSNQRDHNLCDSDDATNFLLILADQNNTFGSKILRHLPRVYGFEVVVDWMTLSHIKDYVAKIRQSKAEIDKAKHIVSKPQIDKSIIEIRETDRKSVGIPEGATGLVFTIDGSDPRQSETARKIADSIDLRTILRDQSNVKVQIRAVDNDGNMSDKVVFEVVSHERKYDVQIEECLVGEHKAEFIWPSDISGFVAVLKSLLGKGVSKKLLNKEQAGVVLSSVSETLKSE